jgi:hypothetical protein
MFASIGLNFEQQYSNPEWFVARAAIFCTLAPNILRASAWNVLHVTLVGPSILHFLPNNWKIFATLVSIIDTFMNNTLLCVYV